MQRLWDWWVQRRNRRATSDVAIEESYGSKREQAEAKARRARELSEQAERARPERESTTLLGGLFGWLSRKKRVEPIAMAPEETPALAQPSSMWQGMPRTLVDAPPVTALQHGCRCCCTLRRSACQGSRAKARPRRRIELHRSHISPWR